MDFLINYYVIFLMNHHLSMTTGFLIWHAVTFVVMLVILFAAVLFFNLIENVLLTKFFAKDSSEAYESPSKMPSTYGFPSVISLGSILIMWLLLSLSTSLYPVKTDIGILLFIAFLFVPVLSILSKIEISDDKESLKFILKNVLFLCSGLIPVVLSVLNVLFFTDSPSFRDIISVQNTHGIFTLFCFPCFLGVFVILYSLASVLSCPIFQNRNNPIAKFLKDAYFITVSAYLSILFFGGYISPLPFGLADFFGHSSLLYGLVLSLEQVFWLLLKAVLIYFCIIYLNNCFVKDVKTEKFWKYLLPLAVFNLLFVAFLAVKLGDFYVL